MTGKKIVLDAGHGGKDAGAVNGKHREAVYALSIAKKVGAMLEERGHTILYTRTGDTYVNLKERASFSNREEANVFISIHCNASENKDAQGVETFHCLGSSPTSRRLAFAVQKYLARYTGDKDRGVKTASFYVLKNTKAKAVLVETGFISHDETAEKLATDFYQERIARAIADGVIELFG